MEVVLSTSMSGKLQQVICHCKLTLVTKFKVSTIPAYWNWVNGVLIPGLYIQSRYNGDTRLSWREAMATADPNLIRVGVGRLRQQRLKPNGRSMVYMVETI